MSRQRRRRYTVEVVNIYPRPFRVIDNRKRAILLQSKDKTVADALADKYEEEWQASPTLLKRLLNLLPSFPKLRSRNNERNA